MKSSAQGLSFQRIKRDPSTKLIKNATWELQKTFLFQTGVCAPWRYKTWSVHKTASIIFRLGGKWKGKFLQEKKLV